MVRATSLLVMTFFVLLSPGSTVIGQDDSQKQVKIEFAGGTVTEYIEFLNSKFDKINTVVDTPAAHFVLPSIRVTTDAEGAVMVLEGLSFNNRQIRIKREIEFYQNSRDLMAQIVLDGDRDIVQVVNVKSLLKTMDQDDLLEVAKFGLEVHGSEGQVKLSLHRKTGILFVKGEESAVQLILETIDQLSIGQYELPSQGGADEAPSGLPGAGGIENN